MKKKYIAFALGCLLCIIGLAGWGYQLTKGMIVTDLRNPFVWGLYIATFEFFIGASSGGTILFSAAYLFHKDYLKPYAKLAALTSFACVIAAGSIILPDIGRAGRIWQMLLTPNLQSPLVWDVIVLVLYLIFTLVTVCFLFIPDSKKNAGNQEVKKKFEGRIHAMAVIGIPAVIILNLVTGLLFATQNSREWWNSPILPVDSVALAGALGLALVMIVFALATGKKNFEANKKVYDFMGKVIAVSLLAHFIFTVMELSVLAWSGTAQSKELLGLLFGTYGGLYAVELILPAIAMILFATRKGRGSFGIANFMSILVIVGAFAHRMMMLYPAYNSIPFSIPIVGVESYSWPVPISVGEFISGSPTFVTFWNYMPSGVEWAVALLPFGVLLFIVAGMMSINSKTVEA